jgi:enamine deaminase RidA (YjgF/YER057c/UK114 family)
VHICAHLWFNPYAQKMSDRIDARLTERGIELPDATKPVANFVPCVRTGNTLYVSGQISSWNGTVRQRGKVGRDVSVADAREGARLCALNVLAQARAFLGGLDRVTRVCMVQGFVNSVPEFTEHPAVLNGASDLLVEIFGDAGRHARFAVGVPSLPFDAAVEVAAVLDVA